MEGKISIVMLFMHMVVFSMFIIATIMPTASGIIDQNPRGVESWFAKTSFKKEKITKLHFYFHTKRSGLSPTAVLVASANTTTTSPSLFGAIVMIDDPLTLGVEPHSTELGRAKGIYASADLKEFGFHMTLNFVFTTGKYNGSTLSMLSHNPVLHKYREMSIVGGTGVFRLARGIATAKTIFVDFTLFDAIVEYNIVVFHY